jgi:hypothetical protein
MRCAHFRRRFRQVLDFVGCPPSKSVPLRIIATPKFLLLAANPARGVQFVIATVQLVDLQFERPIVVRTSDKTVLPELLHDPMRLLC